MILVFAGPSIDRASIAQRLDCICLPPCSQGDIYRASLRRPHAIVVIDGYFGWTPAVWHKELLWAMAQGIHCYGGSSMGALRAAELHPFGMVGVGRIFEWYRDGEIEDDAEVALLHAPESMRYRVATIPLVNLRAALERAVFAGALDAAAAAGWLARGQALHFAERSVEALFGEAPPDWWTAHAVDQKRADALTLIDRVAADAPALATPFVADFAFERTVLWDDLVARAGQAQFDPPARHQADVGRIDPDRIGALIEQGPGDVRDAAAQMLLALTIAADRGVTAGEDEVIARLDRLRRDHGLLTPDALAAWCAANDLTPDALLKLVMEDCLAAKVIDAAQDAIAERLADILRLRGGYAALKAQPRATG